MRGDLPTIGFTGSITAIAVSELSQYLPSQASRPLWALLIGLFASAASFELLSQYVRMRLRQERAGLERLAKEFRTLEASIEQLTLERIRHLIEQGAPKKRITELEAELDQMRAQYTHLFSKVRVRVSRIIDQVSE